MTHHHSLHSTLPAFADLDHLVGSDEMIPYLTMCLTELTHAITNESSQDAKEDKLENWALN